jgi:hypothetical protein
VTDRRSPWLIARQLHGLHLAGAGPRPAGGRSCPTLNYQPSVRRGSGVKRDFACTLTGVFPPVLVALRAESRLGLEGRTRTLSGPSPDLSVQPIGHSVGQFTVTQRMRKHIHRVRFFA